MKKVNLKLVTFMIFLGVIQLFMVSFGYTEGPSFDCSKATTKIEKVICSEKRFLAPDDYEMASLYNTLYKLSADKYKPEVKSDQKKWLTRRNNCVNSEDIKRCVVKKYQQRIEELKNKLEDLSSRGNEKVRKDCGVYVLVKKSHYMRYTKSKLCELMVKNLNSFSDESFMKTMIKVNKSYNFSTPSWKDVDIEKYIGIVEKEYKESFNKTIDSKSMSAEASWYKFIKSTKIIISRESSFDLDNNGEDEHVINIVFSKGDSGGKCTSKNIISDYFFVLTEDGRVDESYERFNGDSSYHVFFYKGNSFVSEHFGDTKIYIMGPVSKNMGLPTNESAKCIYQHIKYN